MVAHTEACTAIAFNPSGDTLATGGADKYVRLWNVKKMQEIAGLKSKTHSIKNSKKFWPLFVRAPNTQVHLMSYFSEVDLISSLAPPAASEPLLGSSSAGPSA